MIEWIEFKNFKALRDAKLPLSRFTLIVGANGSGKSTALKGVLAFKHSQHQHLNQLRTAGVSSAESITLTAGWKESGNDYLARVDSRQAGFNTPALEPVNDNRLRSEGRPRAALKGARLFSLDADAIARSVQLQARVELEANGAKLAVVLDRLRDENPERFGALNEELSRWIPEFDAILFDTPQDGYRSIALRTREGKHSINAADLSHGTLIALALLTIAYLPEPPSIVCLEEPDHGLHPRLLRDVKDALYRLAYPEGSGEQRDPVQVIATTHNPYFLDLFREHPEEIVIAEKVGLEAKFSRLSDRTDLEEILADAPLSEVWYSGVLGGVPAGT
jgi:predicted ATPase